MNLHTANNPNKLPEKCWLNTENIFKLSWMIFRPTIGSTNENEILSAVKELNQQRVAVHTIGFGTLVDMDFLTKLSGQNGGVSRRVFESLDAATQVSKTFLYEVASSKYFNNR